MKYYIEKPGVNANVSYKIINREGKVTFKKKNVICFSRLFQQKLAPTTKSVVFYKYIDEIPYEKSIIREWVKVITSLGFPCKVEFEKSGDSEICNFIFEIEKYKYRPQLLSAVSLARCLTEEFICYIPSHFFEALDKNPKINKFKQLLSSHYKISENNDLYGWPNTHHMVTCYGNGRKVTLKQLFENFANNEKAGLFSNGFCSIENDWRA